MKKMKRLAAVIVLALAAAPILMVFNEDSSRIYINIIGLAYGVLLTHYGKRFAPPFVRDYLEEAE